jgi:group I intron endonuclease
MPRRPKKYHYLYKTTNTINQKFYIGMHSTDNLDDQYLGSGKYLRNSIKKYGRDKFKIEFLEFFESRKSLIEREEFIVNSDFIKDPLCMNLRTGGTGGPDKNFGSKRSEETKFKMSKWIRTPEMRENMRNAQLGKKASKITKLKQRLKKLGTTHTAETKLKMSSKKIGVCKSDETKLKMRKPKSDTHKENMRKPKALVKCPFCGKIGGINGMTRYHFNNCKNEK